VYNVEVAEPSSGYFDSHLLPTGDNEIDIGQSKRRFANIHGTNLHTSALLLYDSSRTMRFKLDLDEANQRILFRSPYSWDFMFCQDIMPSSDNAFDLGSEILRWRNGHFAGSLFVDGDVYGVRVPIIWDDTLVSAGTSETEVKYARFAKHSTYEPISRLIVLASLWTTSGTAYLKVYINDEASPRLTLSTTSTSETLVAGEVDISDLGDGIHTIHVKIYSDSGTAYNKLLEVWGIRR